MRLVLLLASLAAGAAPLVAQKAALPPEISKERRAALDQVFDHWEVATVDAQSTACGQNGEAAPALVEGDFNSDGLKDLALAVKTATGVRLVTVIARLEESNVIDVDTLGEVSAAGTLGMEPRGKAYKDPGDKLDDYFTTDTLTVTQCGQPPTAYMWNGYGFRKVVISPSSGPAQY